MLAKKNDYYRQVFEQEDGTVFTTQSYSKEYQALTDHQYANEYASRQTLKGNGYELLPLDWYNLSAGDWVELKGDKHRIQSASGYGKNRFYALSVEGGYGTWVDRTAEELKDYGWTVIQPEPQEVEEMTVAEVCKALGREVKIKKG